jgi:S-DNA-T family DNA segregation ATPase FtsK/SpoIIIE
MGPLGHTIGTLLNKAFGFSAYLVVLALVIVSFRIFAGGLGVKQKSRPFFTLWRERIGLLLITFWFAIVLYLVSRPYRVAEASAGGWIGEMSGEVLCAIVSTPGAWIIALSGLALSISLATNFSWAGAGLWLWRWSRRALLRATERLPSIPAQLSQSWHQLVSAVVRHREIHTEADGSAALLPPGGPYELGDSPDDIFLRGEGLSLDLPELLSAERGQDDGPAAPKGKKSRAAARRLEEQPLSATSFVCDQEETPREATREEPAAGALAAAEETGENGSSAIRSREKPGVAAKTAAVEDLAESATLKIVESKYQKELAAASEGEIDEEKQIEPTDGPGFYLHHGCYRPPPLSLLEIENKEETNIDREAIFNQADRLVKTLADYKIAGRITEVHPGPVVTMYEFVPAPGIRISKVASLANDLAMSLAAQRVRIVAPIPGKGAIGIEVPNEQRETVYYKEIVSHDAFRKSKSKLTLALGKNIVGAPVTLDLAKMPHLLVAGATGSGKSVSINAMICSLLMKSTPEEVRLIMVDPKYLELSGYNDIPHLLLPVVTDPTKANIALRWAVREMERRYQLLAEMQVRDIKSYNQKVDRLRGESISSAEPPGEGSEGIDFIQEAAPSEILVVKKNEDGSEEQIGRTLELLEQPSAAGEPEDAPEEGEDEDDSAMAAGVEKEEAPLPSLAVRAARPKPWRKEQDRLPRRLPYVVVVIDEFADLMMVASKDVETSVARLAQKARAAGIHVILATQRPSVDVITGLIKANFPSRISFQVASMHDSKTILGTMGAENLLGSGDMLVLDRGADMKRLHGAYISDREIQRIVDWLKEQGRPVYDMDILKPPDEEEDANALPAEDFSDEMYDQAVALVAETRQASISMIQRRLRIGYNRAARMVERMEREGLVGPADGVRGREVLIQSY